jgi:hypothetical protein
MTSQGLRDTGVRVVRISIHPVIALGNIIRPTPQAHFAVPRSCSLPVIVSGVLHDRNQLAASAKPSQPQLSSLLVCSSSQYTALVVIRCSEKSLAAMIRRGRAEGWLRQPIDVLPRWASFHGVEFNHVKIGPLPGYESRGSTVIADQKLVGGSVEPLIIVPKELIVSRRNIKLFSKSDHHLREVLEALGDFGRV